MPRAWVPSPQQRHLPLSLHRTPLCIFREVSVCGGRGSGALASLRAFTWLPCGRRGESAPGQDTPSLRTGYRRGYHFSLIQLCFPQTLACCLCRLSSQKPCPDLPSSNPVSPLPTTSQPSRRGGEDLCLKTLGTSLAVQWLRIRLPMQGTRVRSLVGEIRSHMLRSN